MLKYEQAILDSFKKLGKTPRGHQLADIHYILEAYLDRGKTKVILSAPTGSGKSIIGAVVADVLHALSTDKNHHGHHIDDVVEREGSFILVGTNILATQYADTFENVRDFLQVKGANNYECRALSTFTDPVFADSCCESDMKKSKQADLLQMVDKYCGKCEYAYVRKAKHKVQHLITNYSYFFIDRLFTKQHAYRTITVWDEAHTLNDTFAEHCAVFVSDKRLTQIAEEITEVLQFTELEVFKFLKDFKNSIKNGHITENNYLEYLEKLHKFYKRVEDEGKLQAKSLMIQSNLKEYGKISKIAKKYGDMACKIGDLLSYMYEHIFELNTTTKELIVKPIFVGDMFQTLVNSKYQLFMSATVSGPLLIDTLALNPDEVEFIKLPPYFPVDNKKMIFLSVDKLNYVSMKDPKVQTKLVKACVKLVDRHINEGENGIILTPSFDVTEMISKSLTHVKLFQHERGTKLAPLVEKFKKCNEPSVLISPSMFEGLSLDDDLSRFQIYVKAPYASLGEKRVKYIADNYKQLYELQTILRIIQGAGRSVRSEEDYATTYMLDSMLSYLWKSRLNEWKDEFSVSYQTLM
jgi:ATP-dependent DNA helicase DinG